MGEGRYFIATAAPPPTSSILTLDDADGTQFFVVDKVVEVEAEGQVRGVLGKLTDAEAHEEASKLGTEHLDDGEAPDEGAPAMAMPAPVVEPDSGDEEVDEAERQRLEGDDESAAEGGTPDEASADGEASETDGQSNGRRGKRRRGRKRR